MRVRRRDLENPVDGVLAGGEVAERASVEVALLCLGIEQVEDDGVVVRNRVGRDPGVGM